MRLREMSMLALPWLAAAAAGCAPQAPPPAAAPAPVADGRTITLPQLQDERPTAPGRYGEEILANSAD